MLDNYRHFTVGPDPFGRTWKVDFRWQQTAISIRHSDSVDAKFQLSSDGRTEEKVVSLMHPDLLALSAAHDRPLTDAWVMRLAALHLREMILTGEDMEKTLVTIRRSDLERHLAALERPLPAASGRN